MGAITHPQLTNGERVHLALEPPFRVGALGGDPPMRQISNGELHETLEPRVMQVLIALAQAHGRVVSRDELIHRCWDGRIVSEDAIHRALSRLRQLSAGIGADSFAIETIRGVGYRLTETGGTELSASADEARSAHSRRTVIAGTVAAATAAAVGGAWFFLRPQHEPLPLAVQYYERGLATRGQRSLELYEQGTALLREATRIDPLYSDAWGALAWNYRGLLQFGPRADWPRLEAQCRSAAARALELDRHNVEAQAALVLLPPFFRNWLKIERGLRELIDRYPRNSLLEYNLGYTLADVGRWSESIPWFRSVAARERFWPLPHIDLMKAVYASGRLEETEDLIEEGMKRFPRRSEYWMTKVRYLALAGRYSEALAFANDAASRPALKIDRPLDFEIIVVNALADGSRRARESALQNVSDLARKDTWYLPVAATTAAVLGNVEASFSMLEGFFFGRGPWAAARDIRAVTQLLFVPATAALRTDPRFRGLLREAGLEDYWRASGSLPDYRRSG